MDIPPRTARSGAAGRPRRARPLDALVAADPLLRELSLRTQRLVALQSALVALLPPRAPVSVSGLDDDGLLRVQVDSPAWANRLRQSAPSMAAKLAAQGHPVTGIRLRTRRSVPAAALPVRPRAPIPGATLAEMARFSETLEPGPLRDALGRLLRHRPADTPTRRRTP